MITHSPAEAELLRREVGFGKVHVVPFAVPSRRPRRPFTERHGVAILGSFGHPPNPDAVHYLAPVNRPVAVVSVSGIARPDEPDPETRAVAQRIPPALHRSRLRHQIGNFGRDRRETCSEPLSQAQQRAMQIEWRWFGPRAEHRRHSLAIGGEPGEGLLGLDNDPGAARLTSPA